VFSNNTADIGGAVITKFEYFSLNATWPDVLFLNNSAKIGGGLLVFNASRPLPIDHFGVFEQNSAFVWGTNAASNIWKLEFVTPPSVIVWPGQQLVIQLVLGDYFENFARQPHTSLAINANQNLLFTSNVPNDAIPKSNNGSLYQINNALFLGPATSDLQFVEFVAQQARVLGTEYTATLTAQIVECIPGYTYESISRVCIACEVNQYSWGAECIDCPNIEAQPDTSCLISSEGALNYIGSFITSIGPGVWPSPDFVNPTELLSCPNIEACLEIYCATVVQSNGSWNIDCTGEPYSEGSESPYCATGYTDRLCSKCVCTDDNCYDQSNAVCIYCESSVITALYLALSGFIVLTGIFFAFPSGAIFFAFGEICLSLLLVFIGLQTWLGFIASTWILLFVAVMSSSVSSSTLKAFINFGQLGQLLILPSLWATWLPIDTSDSGGLFSLPGLECIFHSFAENVGFKFIFSMLIPVALMSIVFFMAILMSIIKLAITKIRGEGPFRVNFLRRAEDPNAPDYTRLTTIDDQTDIESVSDVDRNLEIEPSNETQPQRKVKWVSASTIKAMLFISFSCYISLSIAVLTVMAPCENGYSATLPWLQCSWSNSTYVVLMVAAIFFLIVYVLGIPALYAVLLFYHKRQQLLTQKASTWSTAIEFLCEEYRPKMYYYELVYVLRRLLLVVCVTIIPSTTIWQYGCAVSVIMISVLVQIFCRPFKCAHDNYIEIIGALVLAVCYSASWLLQCASFESAPMFQSVATIVFFTTLLGIFVAIFVPLFQRIYFYIRSKLSTQNTEPSLLD